ncbi:MAG: hypothetical protein E7365_01250 [Clostridiales bacterium]|nr:hypothetical protein [Clostridiales bacterium]
MKIKSLIKLICLVVIVAFLGLWAFGANVTLFTKKFVAWDKNMFKGNDLGLTNATVYSISAPENTTNFDAHAAAINAVEVFKTRAELMGYKNATVRLMGRDQVFVGLPINEAQLTGGLELFETNGQLTVANEGKTVFTNADVKKAQITGVNADYDAYCLDITFTKDAAKKLQEITSKSSYTISFAIDGTKITSTYKGNEPIKNGKLTLEFELSKANDMAVFEYCVNSGSVDGTIKAVSSYVIEGTAGAKAFTYIALAVLVILVLAAVYMILSNRMLGVAASVSMLIALILTEFFAATFTWLSVDAWAVAGLVAGFVLTVITHVLVINSISKQYQMGKGLTDALDSGVMNIRNMLFEITAVALVLGVALWICGTNFAFFGLGIMGASIVGAISAWLFVKPIAKIFIGLGVEDAKAYGLKRGEQ